MKVALIQPPGIRVANDPRRVGSPLNLLILAGTIKKYFPNVETYIIDAKAEGNEFEKKPGVFQYGLTQGELKSQLQHLSPDIVGISNIFTSEWQTVAMCAKTAKQVGAIVILGGHHPTYMSEFMLENTLADIIVYGEGDIAFQEIIKAVNNGSLIDKLNTINGIVFRSNGKLVRTKPAHIVSNLDELGDYSFNLLKTELYSEKHSHGGPLPSKTRFADWLVSHGCPIGCEFCTSPRMHGKKIRVFSPNRIRKQAQMIRNQGFNRVNVMDDQFLMIPRESLLAMIDELGKQNLSWEIDAGVYYPLIMRNKEIFELAAKNGLKRLYLPMEHPSISIMHGEHKYLNLRNQTTARKTFSEACHLLNTIGINFYVALMVGFPQETDKTLDMVREYAQFARDRGAEFISFFYLKPFPGTPDYRYYNKVPVNRRFENAPEYWGLGSPVLKPDSMTIYQLQEKVEEISLQVNGRLNRIPGATSKAK